MIEDVFYKCTNDSETVIKRCKGTLQSHKQQLAINSCNCMECK